MSIAVGHSGMMLLHTSTPHHTKQNTALAQLVPLEAATAIRTKKNKTSPTFFLFPNSAGTIERVRKSTALKMTTAMTTIIITGRRTYCENNFSAYAKIGDPESHQKYYEEETIFHIVNAQVNPGKALHLNKQRKIQGMIVHTYVQAKAKTSTHSRVPLQVAPGTVALHEQVIVHIVLANSASDLIIRLNALRTIPPLNIRHFVQGRVQAPQVVLQPTFRSVAL